MHPPIALSERVNEPGPPIGKDVRTLIVPVAHLKDRSPPISGSQVGPLRAHSASATRERANARSGAEITTPLPDSAQSEGYVVSCAAQTSGHARISSRTYKYQATQ